MGFLKYFLLVMSFFLTSGPIYAKSLNPEQEIISIIEEKTKIHQDNQDLLFKKPLRLKQILWLALTRNPELKSKIAEAQISVAEMKQLGMIESPQIEFSTHFPLNSGFKQDYHLQVTQNLIDLIQLPGRKKIGRLEYEGKKWETASDILKILTEVKAAYYNYQAALQLGNFWQSNFKAAHAQAYLSQQQREAGNINALDEAQNQVPLKMAELELAKNKGELIQARIHLAKLTGLPVQNPNWKIVGQLPLLPAQDPNLEQLKKWAKIYRPDLIAQKHRIESKKSNLNLAKKAILPEFNVGVATDWDPEGSHGIGPVIGMGFPFLGHRKAAIQKAKAELNVSQHVFNAMEQNTPYDLDVAYQQLAMARQTVRFYQNEILPIQEKVQQESIKHYNYMLLGNYQLLQSRQNQINAKKDAIQALRDYWISYTELENLVGGDLSLFQKKAPLKRKDFL